jgi:nucleoside-diphosphate-sugar epimerase
MATLVTGAGGFIGLNLVEALLGDGETVRALDARPLTAAAVEAFAKLPGTLVPCPGDMRQTASLEAAFALAAAAGVQRFVYVSSSCAAPPSAGWRSRSRG